MRSMQLLLRLMLAVLLAAIVVGVDLSPHHTNAATPTLKSIGASGSVTGGGEITIKVTLTGKASSTTAVSLKSNRPSVASPPATISVPSGASSASIKVRTRAANQQATVTLTAKLGTVTKTVQVVVKPPALSGVSMPGSVQEGAGVNVTIRLNSVAPSGGMVVSLAATKSLLTGLPATAKVPGGKTGVAIRVTAGAVSSNQSVTVTGSLNGVSKSSTITITDAASPTSTATPTNTATPTATASATATMTATATATLPPGIPFTDNSAAPIFSGNGLPYKSSLQANESQRLQISIINWTTTNTNVHIVASAAGVVDIASDVVILPGSTQVLVPIKGLVSGTTTLTATNGDQTIQFTIVVYDVGFQDNTAAPIFVANGLPWKSSLQVGENQRLVLGLSEPVQSDTTVTVSQSTSGIVDFPSSILFTTGQQVLYIPITGLVSGTTVLTVTNQTQTIQFTILVYYPTVEKLWVQGSGGTWDDHEFWVGIDLAPPNVDYQLCVRLSEPTAQQGQTVALQQDPSGSGSTAEITTMPLTQFLPAGYQQVCTSFIAHGAPGAYSVDISAVIGMSSKTIEIHVVEVGVPS